MSTPHFDIPLRFSPFRSTLNFETGGWLRDEDDLGFDRCLRLVDVAVGLWEDVVCVIICWSVIRL